MAALVNGLYVDFWRYEENRIYAFLYGVIARNDNTVTFSCSSGQVRLDQVTQYGSRGYTMPFVVKNASGTTVNSGSVWWEYDYMYPATFWKNISGLSPWSYTVSTNATSMGLYLKAEDGDKYTTVSFPARPQVTVQSVTDTSVTLGVSIAGYGDTSSGSRYIEGAILGATNTSYGAPYKYKTATATTSTTFTINNSTHGSGTLTLSPNTRYKYGGYASTATDRYAQTITGTVTTACSAPTLTLGSLTATAQGTTAHITASRASDGGVYTSRALKMRYSWGDENSYGEWETVGNLDGSKMSELFSISGLRNNDNYWVQVKVVTTAGDSPVSTLHISTPKRPRVLLAPKSVSATKSLDSTDDAVSFTDGTGNTFAQTNPEKKVFSALLYYQDGHVYCRGWLDGISIDNGTFTQLGTTPELLSERGLSLDQTVIVNHDVDDPVDVSAYWKGHEAEKTQKLYASVNDEAKKVKKLYGSVDGKAVLLFNK